MLIFNTLSDDDEGNEQTSQDETVTQTLGGQIMSDVVVSQAVRASDIHQSPSLLIPQATAARDALLVTNQDTGDASNLMFSGITQSEHLINFIEIPVQSKGK